MVSSRAASPCRRFLYPCRVPVAMRILQAASLAERRPVAVFACVHTCSQTQHACVHTVCMQLACLCHPGHSMHATCMPVPSGTQNACNLHACAIGDT
eukprot:4479196-Pleurochrysis_carterae.AAC.4